MAAMAARSGIQVEPGTFEEWPARGRTFDLVVSGQAWHWVHPDRGAAKAAAVLRPGGRAGMFWNQGLIPDPVKDRLRGIYRRLPTGLDEFSMALGNVDDGRFAATSDALRRTGDFEDPDLRSFIWHRHYTTEQWLDQLPTHSDHRGLPADLLSELLDAVGTALDDAGGGFDMTYRAWLVSARRKGRPTDAATIERSSVE
jgi:SAM-dependent methyltransferase